MTTRSKLKPIHDVQNGNDGYRGDHTIAWRLDYAKRERPEDPEMVFTVFATWCRCGQSWGWTIDVDQARLLYKAMHKHGCPRCAKSSTKEQKGNKG